jgi:predicted signal transduction protein with EAL and GGDEF domain
MLRAQTSGNSEIHEVFVKKIVVVDLRAGRSDAIEALRRWEAAAGIHARSQAIDLECTMLIDERPRQHKSTS